MKMVVIDGVRYDPTEADKLGIEGKRVEVAIKEAAELERLSAAYGAEVRDGEVVDLTNSNAANSNVVEGSNAAGKPRGPRGADKEAK